MQTALNFERIAAKANTTLPIRRSGCRVKTCAMGRGNCGILQELRFSTSHFRVCRLPGEECGSVEDRDRPSAVKRLSGTGRA